MTVAAGLAPVRVALAHGVVVLALQTRTTPAVTIEASVAAGARFDPEARGGAAAFVARMLDRGTRTRSADQVAEALDERGVAIETVAGRRDLMASCTCLAEDAGDIIDLLGESLVHPAFDPHEVDGRRGEMLADLREAEDDPAEVAGLRLMAELYGAGHPYGRPPDGTRASVRRIERPDLERFHGAWFAPSRTTVAVVGDMPAERAVDAVARAFDGWTATPAPDPGLPEPAGVPGRRLVRVPMPGKAQSDIAYGFVGLPRRDPAWDAASLMVHVVGQYALGGRLGQRIRERDGMAYYAYGGLEPDVIAGPLVVRAGVDHANVDRTIAAIDEELRRFREQGPTADEVDESRQYLLGSMPRLLETNAGIAAFLMAAEMFGLGLDYDVRMRERLAAVRTEDVHAAARRLIDPDRATIVVAG